ncbi:4a-hydroxytetrahydrobiopterin dehydratase [Asanoa sp. WMMD1127]|uniref:4a-hydroxytetrahydrobiopterin dehydratase n=1 Tax=Asanoa sp. WMMD1127 TaxID=3016107 RepID=UPI0024174234|nr:4a-hydroxytetrahydrobiopterin dehydratase [Asanoa sp. WMMD1127]MDG4823962.1 4a-hydroxytetrahydrobiopterin dehydratase [Asanoa sp. WMMD1127]
MAPKEMEGDNRRRRQLAREARNADRSPSAEGVTLGASKQQEHQQEKRRSGPPSAGRHKPQAGAEQITEPGTPSPQWPRRPPVEDDSTDAGAGPRLRYRELVTEIATLTGEEFAFAKELTRAVVGVTARSLDEPDGKRLIASLPAELEVPRAMAGPPERDLTMFLRETGRLVERRPEQIRVKVQAVFAVLGDAGLDLPLPPALRELADPLPPEERTTPGRPLPLSDADVVAALRDLPDWEGDHHAISRTIELPPDNLDRVLPRIERLRETGRAPHIARPSAGTATLTAYTAATGAVTEADVTLAHRVDTAIDEAGGGMAG